MSRNSSGGGACGCLVSLIWALGYVVSEFVGPKSCVSSTEKSSKSQDIEQVETQREKLSDEDEAYLNNSLFTGATPYRSVYGGNYRCPYSQCSGISVTAPSQSDIVVIIKQDNANGKVIAHGYIKAGGTYQFDVPDGTYQTFFYYGEGWNPNKDMGNGVKGGFVKDEIFSKDNPQVIFSAVLSYVLQLQHNGNFSTKSSNRGEVF